VIFTFSHCWNRRNKLSKEKIRQSTLVFGCFFSPNEVEKLFDFDFHKLHNMTNVFVQNLCFYHARFSLQSLFKTTPCPLKRQRENHTSVLASDSSHEYTVDWQSSRKFRDEAENETSSKTPRPRLETSKFVHIAEIFQKSVVTFSDHGRPQGGNRHFHPLRLKLSTKIHEVSSSIPIN